MVIEEADLSGQLTDIKKYADKACLNYLVVLNSKPVMDVDVDMTKLIKQMDMFLPLPFNPYHDKNVTYLASQKETAYWFTQCVCELLTTNSLICVDIADVRTELCRLVEHLIVIVAGTLVMVGLNGKLNPFLTNMANTTHPQFQAGL